MGSFLRSSAAGCISSLLLVAGCATVPPPNEQVAVAKAAIANAVSAGATATAPAELQAAREKLDQANQAMIAKDHAHARVLAEQAEVDAQLAAAKARAVKAEQAAATTEDQNRVLKEEMMRKSR